MYLCGNLHMIGSRLREERERLALNQESFAELAGAKRRTLIDWEKGVSSPTAVQLQLLSDAGVDVQFVITGQRVIPSGILDEVKLEQSIEQSEKLMQLAGKRYTSAQKAKIIGLVYQVYVEENKLSDESLGRILRLVS